MAPQAWLSSDGIEVALCHLTPIYLYIAYYNFAHKSKDQSLQCLVCSSICDALSCSYKFHTK